MKNHHSYPVQPLGYSDIASLVVVSAAENTAAHIIHFGSDGSYSAYIVDSECEIPSHYSLALHVDPYTAEDYSAGWIKIYDDERVVYNTGFHKGLNIYRSGDFGCIIQVL